MDLNNISELLGGMKEYYDSHDIKKSDIFLYEALRLNKNPDARIKNLADKDKYGEYIGRCARGWIASDLPGMPSSNRITFYLMPDGRLAGVWNSINGMVDAYEIFDYHDGYFTGAMYSIMGSMESHMSFTYYIVNDEGRVTEMLNVYGGMVVIDSENVTITRTVLDYEGDETILKSSVDYRYKRTPDGFRLVSENDNTAEPSYDERVIDDQKGLCKELKKAVKKCSTLEELVNAFFDTVRTAEENPEEEISYTAGTVLYEMFGMAPECVFCLMRWTPAEDDEYYQLQLNVTFDIGEEKIPYDNKNDVDGVDALRRSVLDSDSFKALKDRKIRKVKVELVET